MKELKNKLIEIVKMLRKVQRADEDFIYGVITPIDTIEQADKMIEYLNSIDLSTTLQSPILKEALYISDTF